MKNFYEENKELSYDSNLDYKLNSLDYERIPKIIENDLRLKAELERASNDLATLDKDKLEKAIKLIESDGKILDEKFREDKDHLKKAYSENLISKKAFKSENEQLKRKYEDQKRRLSFRNPEISLKEEIESLKSKIKSQYKDQMKLLESDRSNAHKSTPIERVKESPLKAILSFIIPGSGQILNGQWQKGIFFLLGTLFIYLLAIPYALGFGNYQGEGIRGLISLAEGGSRLDRSILFMIEGILAIVFIFISLVIMISSFKDARKVSENIKKGIRANTFYETKKVLRTEGFPFVITSPALLVIIFIVIVPILTAILISFTNMDPQHQNKFSWVGLENYLTIAKGQGIAGRSFWKIFIWTIIWTLTASTLSIFLGFIFALLVNNERVRFKKVFRTIYLLPWAIPAFITIMFFSIMTSRGGIIATSLNDLFGLTLDIKNNTMQTRTALVLLQAWLGHSYIFLLTTGVLQAIPKDLYEAASIDGAKGIQQTMKITIPLVLFQIAPMLINQYTFNFNNFSIIYLYNQGGPFNPQIYGNLAGSSDILISYIYKLTMDSQYQAIGAAITVFISLILIVISYFAYSNSKAFKEY